MRKRLRFLYGILGLTVFLLLSIGIVTFDSLRNLEKESDMVAHTNDVLFQLELVISSMKDAETGQRGFMITRDSSFLEPYMNASIQVTSLLKTLDSILNVNPQHIQRERFKQLSYYAILRNAQLNQSLTVFSEKPGPDQQMRILTRLQRGRSTMDSARTVVDNMQLTEKELLEERIHKKNRFSNNTLGLLSLVSFVAVMVFSAAFYFLILEIRRRREYELQLEKSVTDLLRSNHDLEQFAYVASHHLQEPLRKVRTFGNRLVQKHGKELDEDAQFVINRMNGSAEYMQILLDDLLIYTGLGLHGEINAFKAINLSQLIQRVTEKESARIEAAGAKIHWDKHSWEVRGDEKQLELLFTHLLQNSLKFVDENLNPVISIHTFAIQGTKLPIAAQSKAFKQYVKIVFSDNGIGIDMAYSEKIFGLFQRLQTSTAFSGTGVGLAICKRIVTHHHGYIELASSNKGTTFHIYLPLLS